MFDHNEVESSGKDFAMEDGRSYSKHECPICLSCLKEPVLTKCGHHFCNDCIHTWFKKQIVTCPLDGEKLNPEKDLFRDECTKREIQNARTRCSLCDISLSPVELETHLHLNHEEPEAKNGSNLMECALSSVDSKANILQSKNDRRETSMKVLSQETKYWNPDSKNKVETTESEVSLKLLVKSLYERIVVLEQKSIEDRTAIESLSTKLKDINKTHCCGEYLWTISNFTENLTSMNANNSIMLYSDGFYTSPFGYKVCARLNLSPNQNGYLSLLIHLMKSPHDYALDWPFNGRISLSIVHPKNPSFTVKETMISRPELEAFRRPMEEVNKKAFGYFEFISVKDIMSKGFLGNSNSLHVKINVQCV